MRASAKAALGTKFDWLDRHLSCWKYLVDGAFGIADAYAFTVLSWAPHVGIDLARWPGLVAYLARISARPHVRAAMEAEGLLAPQAA